MTSWIRWRFEQLSISLGWRVTVLQHFAKIWIKEIRYGTESVNTLASGRFRGFLQKNDWFAHGFVVLPARNSGAESGRELFKSSKDSAILLVWQKFFTPQQKNLFWVQTTRLAESFELLAGSVVLTRPEKFHHKATCDPAVFARTAWINPGAKVLSKINNFKQW